MTQEALKKMYQLLLTEPHAPTVCAQLERIAREALAEHAMRETQRLGQEIEQEQALCDLAEDGVCETLDCPNHPIEQEPVATVTSETGADITMSWWHEPALPIGTKLYTTPPQRTEQEPVIECDCETATSPDGSRLTKCGSDQMLRAVEEGHAFCKQPAQVAKPCKQQEPKKDLMYSTVAMQEPVAYAVYHRMGGSKSLHWLEQHSPNGDESEYRLVPLYTAPPQRTEQNFCPRCGKRTKDIHTCTPPRENT